MPIDASIYNLLDTKSLATGIPDAIGRYQESQDRQNRLSQLSQQQELVGQQLRAGQRAEAAIPEQKRQKDMQELSAALAFGIQQKNGISNQQLMDSTYQEAMRRGLKDQDVAQLFQPWASVAGQTDGQDVADVYAQQANPQEAIKQRLEAMNRKTAKTASQSALATLIAERDQIASMNPQDQRLGIYDQMIEKTTTQAPQMQIVTSEGGGMSAVTLPKTPGQKATVQPLGIQAVPKVGKGGTPEEKAMQQEQVSLSSQQVLDQAEKLFNHPGRAAGTGASSWMSKIPGTEAKGFGSNLETFKSQTFLPMVSALKGMGALSDAEGKKITASVGALDPDMPEKEFEDSLKDTTRFLFSKAKAAGLNVQMPSFLESRQKPTGGAKFLGFE